MCGFEAHPYSLNDVTELALMQTEFGRSMLKYHGCPHVAVLGELGWPAVSDVTVLQNYAFLIRLRNFYDNHLVEQALQ